LPKIYSTNKGILVTNEQYDTVLSALKHFIGRRCVGFSAGKGTGSVVSLEFEPRRPRQKPLTNPHLTEEQRTSDAEYALFVECSWRLDDPREVICGAWDDNSTGGTMLRGLQGIVGHKVEFLRLGEPGLDLEISFENGWIFRIFCDQVNEEDRTDNYSVFSRGEVWVIGTKSRLRRDSDPQE
jgi:hypothetical protein